MSRPWRLAALTSHPIQYQSPLFRKIAEQPDIDLHVFYGCRWGVEPRRDPEFGVEFQWDVPLLEGFEHTFLRSARPAPHPGGFLGLINPDALTAFTPQRFDALWVHGWGYLTHWLAIWGASARGLPVLLRGEANDLERPHGQRAAWKERLIEAVVKRADVVLTIGSLNEDFYRRRGVRDDRLARVPYAVDNDLFFARATELSNRRAEIRARLGIGDDDAAVLFCGKLVAKKRPHDLLEAHRRLSPATGSHLLFAGDGPLMEELEKAARGDDRVHFLGFVNQAGLPELYVASDLLCLPSDFEPWGLVVNEAMCFGLPVLASDRVGAALDLVVPDRTGKVFRAGDVESLTSNLEPLLRDRALREAMGEEARRLIETWGLDADVRGVREALGRLESLR